MFETLRLALSVRKPSAWATIAGHKPIENRTMSANRAGRMTTGRVCIQAAASLKEEVFHDLSWQLGKHKVTYQPPLGLTHGVTI